MNTREKHVGKSPAAREFYARYIKGINCDPTVDEKFAFSPSTEAGEELREPTSIRRRRVSPSQKIQEHFQAHWADWIFGLFIAILAWLMIDARGDLVRIETHQSAQKESIDDLKNGSQKAADKNQEQDLTLREYSIRISNVEKKIDEKE